MRTISASLSKEQKLHRSLLKVQGLLFQIKKLLTVQNNCGDFFCLVSFGFDFCVEVYIMRKFSAQTQILFLLVCPTFYGSAILGFLELECRSGARFILKIIIIITNTVLPEVLCQRWVM